ncbi:ZIP family metal transporter [Pseudarthrobacter sp. NPDC092184]|uniref:ZIP family metal transporter n=1 Tax=Pseudarthrobacter TaxID=1742993 RepID=UPI001CC6AEF6|nr:MULTISPECIES: ZIP family metal transporter [unclassified Pseudarthrobacter]MCQ6269383.1 ZIP family metal transporter [Pseudarthrobacter sp. R1]BFE45628.1 metal transporter [Pseudarthrobacter oxydans]
MTRTDTTTTTTDTTSTTQTAGGAAPRPPKPRWLLGLGPLVLIAVLLGLFSLLNGPGLSRLGEGVPPKEDVAVEDIRLTPGQIILTVRNQGPDPVSIAQVNVSDYYAPFSQTAEVMAPLQSTTITVSYHWVDGDPYEIALVTSIGGKITAAIDAAALSPERDGSFLGLMALLGVYVGIIPVALGMLWMPFVRRSSAAWVRGLLGVTVGLLAFLTFDATFEAFDLVAGNSSFGGPLVVILGALLSYLVLEATDAWMRRRQELHAAAQPAALPPGRLALLIAVGIGLHNLGEGLAIGSAYAIGSLALGASLIVGFAIHNTTEGLAIVTPLARTRPSLGRLAALGLIAGAPAVLGALIGATVYQPTLGAFLLGVGAGAVGQVAVKLLPLLKDHDGKTLTPLTAGGILAGIAVMFATGLLVVA